MKQKRPHIINQALLWDFDHDTFNFRNLFKVVIERVIERGTLVEWREMVQLYIRKQILETVECSTQLSKRDKDFTKLFLNSDFLKLSCRLSKALIMNHKNLRNKSKPDKTFKQE